MLYFVKGFRSFHIINIESVGQRTSKLLAVKLGVLKKKSVASAIPVELCASPFDLGSVCSGSNHSQSLMASNFAAL